MYRAQKAYFEKHKIYATNIDSLTGLSIIIENKKLNPIIESHKTGYNLSIVSPFTNKILMLKEDGKFISK